MLGPGRWVAMHRGHGEIEQLRACGCDACTMEADRLAAIEAKRAAARAVTVTAEVPPLRVPAGPVREHWEELERAGWSLAAIAAEARVDASTSSRLRQSSARNVARETAARVLAVGGER